MILIPSTQRHKNHLKPSEKSFDPSKEQNMSFNSTFYIAFVQHIKMLMHIQNLLCLIYRILHKSILAETLKNVTTQHMENFSSAQGCKLLIH